MKFFSITTALFAAAAAAAPALHERSAASIEAAITDIQNKVIALNKSVNAFKPVNFNTLPQVFDVLQKSGAVTDSINAATKTAKASNTLNADDSFAVGVAVLNFEPSVSSLLDNLKRRKPDFDKIAGAFSARKTVLQALQTDKTAAANLGAAIKSKVDPSVYDIADNINSDIAGFFDSAIKVYSVKSGAIELPPIPSP